MIISQSRWLNLCCKLISIMIILSFMFFILLSICYPNLEITLSVYRALSSTHVDHIRQLNGYLAILAIITVSIFIVFIQMLRHYHITTKWIDWIFYGELLLFTLCLYYLNQVYHFHFTDDSEIILKIVESLITTHTMTDNYLNFYHNNLPIALIYMALAKIVGATHIDYLINSSIIIYSTTILLMYHTIKQILTNKFISLILSQLLIMLVSVWIHVFNFYTDTLSLFFNMLVVYCLVKLMQQTQYHLKMKWAVLLGIACALAMIIKLTLTLLVIVVTIGLLLILKTYHKGLVAMMLLSIFSIMVSWQLIDQHFTHHYFQQTQKRVPIEHYLAMGMASDYLQNETQTHPLKYAVGSWNFTDVKQSYDVLFVQNRSVEDLKIIKRNLLQQRIDYLINEQQFNRFMIDKLTVSWGTGDLKTTHTLQALTDDPNITDIVESDYLYSYMQYCQFVIYFAIILISIVQLFHRRLDSIIVIYQMFLIGCILFFSMWESSPRYMMIIYPMLPICIAVTLIRKDKI